MALERLLSVPLLQLGHLVSESWSALRRESPYVDVPPLDPSLRLVGEALLDRSFSLWVNLLTGVPHPERVRRATEEMESARAHLEARGHLAEPERFHPAPPPLGSHGLRERRAWIGGRTLRFAHLQFESDFEPHPGMPGGERWRAYAANRSGHAWVLEHRDRTRPWLVCVHGFGMGVPTLDFTAFRARRLHEELGLNLVLPCLPLHGPRTTSRLSGRQLLDPAAFLDVIHLFAQATWDIRRIVSWIRRRGGERIGLYGISLGGYNAALAASLEPGLECVIAGIPAVDFAGLARDNEPWVLRRYLDPELTLAGETLRAVSHVVSPLAFRPRVPHPGRFIFAGIADRVVRPDQARALWRHWDRPEVHWFSGGHVVGHRKREVAAFVERALHKVGFVARD